MSKINIKGQEAWGGKEGGKEGKWRGRGKKDRKI
jgi:hypothetical protein